MLIFMLAPEIAFRLMLDCGRVGTVKRQCAGLNIDESVGFGLCSWAASKHGEDKPCNGIAWCDVIDYNSDSVPRSA